MNDGAEQFGAYVHILAPDLYARMCRECRFAPPRKWRFDWCIPGTAVAIEIDGGQYAARGGRHNRDSDREKINAATALGYRVLRFSTQQVQSDPLTCIEIVRRTLAVQQAAFDGACQRCGV